MQHGYLLLAVYATLSALATLTLAVRGLLAPRGSGYHLAGTLVYANLTVCGLAGAYMLEVHWIGLVTAAIAVVLAMYHLAMRQSTPPSRRRRR